MEMVQPSPDFTVICHGDLWWSNIFFKHDQNQIPLEVKFIDFQSSRISRYKFINYTIMELKTYIIK